MIKILISFFISLTFISCDVVNQDLPQNNYAQNQRAGEIFERCIACHGQNAEKHALGKSDILASYSSLQIKDALESYRAGTRDKHGMGALMKAQVIDFSGFEIRILSVYISEL